MKYGLCLLGAFLVAVAAVSCTHAVPERPQAHSQAPDAHEAKDPDGAASLLPPRVRGGSRGVDGPIADNSRCHVCHINYAEEDLAVTHARANIGCDRCHGSSAAHCSDEGNITPPDIMFSRKRINPFCMECHPRETIGIVKHKAFLKGAGAPGKACTDCHGEHRLSHRSRCWDEAKGVP